jgi:prevent-host-death family protein
MAKTAPVREFRRNLSQLLSDVADPREHVLVSRHGRPAAALVPVDEYEALEESAEILSDPDALSALDAGLAELERGVTVSLDDLRPSWTSADPDAEPWLASSSRCEHAASFSTSTGR